MVKEVNVAHILVKTEEQAKEIIELLKKGESFANIASQKSECPSGKRGGELGWFGRGKMVKEFENAAFNLEKGQTTGPVKTQFGWHIIKSLDTR
ncbi:peptidylprolyl isomerase [Candidatus Altiarchaeota archaeon]